MSLIQTDKKATTDFDARVMLEATYSLQDPLGTPTLFLRPEHHSPHWIEYWPSFLRDTLKDTVGPSNTINREVRTAVDDFVKSGALDSLDNVDRAVSEARLEHSVGMFAKDIAKSNLNPERAEMRAYTQRRDFEKPHSVGEESFQPPTQLTVITPHEELTANLLIHRLTDKARGMTTDLPGTDAQYRFNALWHEIGHGTGAAEPQTEAIAAVMTRRAIEGTAVLQVNADARAVRAVFRHSTERPDTLNPGQTIADNTKYGWPMVEVNDHIASLPQSTIDQMTERDIAAMSFQKFDHMEDTVREVAEKLQALNPAAFRTKNLSTLDSAAQYLRDSSNMSEEGDQVLARFQLAARRLNIGTAAYMPDSRYIDEALSAAQDKGPITFEPGEYIP